MKLVMSEALRHMAAKSDKHNHDGWLPFFVHALDTAAVIKKTAECYDLKNSWQTICNIKKNEIVKTAVLLAALHDIGKLTPSFQSLIAHSLPDGFAYDGIPRCNDFLKRSASPHTMAGECILIELGISDEFASIVGAHHGMPPEKYARKSNMESYPDNYFGDPPDTDFWHGIWEEWLEISLRIAGFESTEEVPVPDKKTQILLSGLLITADWLASSSDNFPLLALDEEPFGEYDEGRADAAWKMIGLTKPWVSDVYIAGDELFYERFGFYPNEVQKTVLDIANTAVKPGIMILEAPMGCGKTEAALMAAEVFAERSGKHGVFFGLPTQATANGIFERFRKWSEGQSEEFYHSIMLAHANAYFQPAFANMPKQMPEVDTDGDKGLIVHPFFTGRKQSCIAEFVVGTVDRMLMAALKRRHTMMLHFGLAQKIVIIDECHSYDAYTNRYLERAIEWLSAYNVPVILLSATLPASRRKALVSAYTGIRPENIVFEKDAAYPVITWSDGANVFSREIEYGIGSKDVAVERLPEETAIDEAIAASGKGACVGIICNTVRKAQMIADAAAERHEANKILLYHAQYIMPDRAAKEERILKAAGKKSSASDRYGLIVVGTQVLEQSLDIDFDLLITELCPMDLLLQRIGRLFRHNRDNRPEQCKNPKCIVVGTGEHDKGSQAVYGKWLLMQTEKYLPDKITIPGDISQLVNDVYEKHDADTEEEKKAYKEYTDNIEMKKKRAGGYLLGRAKGSRFDTTLDGWLAQGVKDAKAEASVRDGDPSVEVLLLSSPGNGYAEFLPWVSEGERIPLFECPPEKICKKIAQQKLKLPGVLCRDYIIDKTVDELESRSGAFAAWQDSHWLNGELILLTDNEFKTELNGFMLEYSKEKGLSYERRREE